LRGQPSEAAFLEIIQADGQILKTVKLINSEDGFGAQIIDLHSFSSRLYAVRIVQANSSITHIFSIIK